MVQSGRIDKARLLELFLAIRPGLACYPALDPLTLERAVRQVVDHLQY